MTSHPGDEIDVADDDVILERIIADLDRVGVIKKQEVIVTDIRRFEYAYPVYDLDYTRNTTIIRQYFASLGIDLLGRFAEFEYINTDECLRRAQALAERLNSATDCLGSVPNDYYPQPVANFAGRGRHGSASYYREHSGFVIAAAIDKYVYITLHRRFVDRYLLKYSTAGGSGDGRRDPASADPRGDPAGGHGPALPRNHQHGRHPRGHGTGLVGQFHHGAAKALHILKKNIVHPAELAEQACHIEIDVLKEPIGKQDQYIAAFGGITCFRFSTTGRSKSGP